MKLVKKVKSLFKNKTKRVKASPIVLEITQKSLHSTFIKLKLAKHIPEPVRPHRRYGKAHK